MSWEEAQAVCVAKRKRRQSRRESQGEHKLLRQRQRQQAQAVANNDKAVTAQLRVLSSDGARKAAERACQMAGGRASPGGANARAYCPCVSQMHTPAHTRT
eukprot:2998034-Pleurochrysis_carterae.AAC.1